MTEATTEAGGGWATAIPEPAAPSAAAEPAILAGWGRRLAAYLIDSSILGLLTIASLSTVLLNPSTMVDPLAAGNVGLSLVGSGLSFVATLVYYALCWSRWAQTPGQALLGLEVRRATDGSRISFWRGVGRYFGFVLASAVLFIGLLWALWDRQRQGWHDKLAGTLVIRTPSLKERGRGSARWAVIGLATLGALVAATTTVISIAIAFSVAFGGARDEQGRLSGPSLVSVYSLRVGDCFDLPATGVLIFVSAGPCDSPHVHEAFANLRLPDGAFPSTEAMDALAFEQCLPHFAGYVGISYDQSVWYIYYLSPTEDAWAAGDRTLTCTLVNEGLTSVTGAARNSAR